MRTIINKKTAITAMVLLIALVAALTVWPFRLWTHIEEYSAGGELVEYSEPIYFEDSIRQKFVSQYERLSSFDIYVAEVERGRYISVSVLDENGAELLNTFVDTEGCELPGWVNVPCEFNTEVGKEYYICLMHCRSKYTVGLEDLTGEAGYAGNLYFNWTEIPGRHVHARYNYRIPMQKSFSLIALMIIAVLTIAIVTAVEMYYAKNPEKNTLSTVEKAVRTVANPIAAIVYGALIVMVFPLKLFDSRVVDIVFYELGLIIAAAMTFYAINHRIVRQRFGISFWQDVPGKKKLAYVLQMLMIALSIWYASEYMNGLYDIYHTLSERRMVICLLLLIVLTFTFKDVFNLPNLVWAIGSVCWGVYYYKNNLMDLSEKEADLNNTALKYLVIIWILAGFVVINLVRSVIIGIIHNVRNRVATFRTRYSVSVFGLILILTLAAIILFRNTRVWGVWLALLFGALYIRFYFWNDKKDWYKILSGGIMLNFAISLGFSLLHRYFPGYESGRFAFIFHTVTVTAEYLTFIGAVAAVMVAIKVAAFPRKLSKVDLFKSAWKEMILFGWIMSYAVFTVSRTAFVAITVCVLAIVIVVTLIHKKQFIRIICIMLCSVIICFPAAFTMQRLIPTIVADPVYYVIDDADAGIRGGADWDHTNFMCVERFVNLCGVKLLGFDIGDYTYPVDKYNYDKNGVPVLDDYGFPIENLDGESTSDQGAANIPVPMDDYLVANGFTRAEYFMLLDTLNGYTDENNRIDVISNGRITIFRSYLKELNMTGHEQMGALLPNGETALHAHNTYIQVAYDNGIITGLLFTIMLIGALIGGISLYKNNTEKNPLSLVAFAIAIGFAVAGMTEWVFHFCNPMTIALMLSFAGMIFKEKKYEQE